MTVVKWARTDGGREGCFSVTCPPDPAAGCRKEKQCGGSEGDGREDDEGGYPRVRNRKSLAWAKCEKGSSEIGKDKHGNQGRLPRDLLRTDFYNDPLPRPGQISSVHSGWLSRSRSPSAAFLSSRISSSARRSAIFGVSTATDLCSVAA